MSDNPARINQNHAVYNVHAPNSTAVISQAEAQAFAPDKRSLYDVLLRNQINLPEFNDPLVTV